MKCEFCGDIDITAWDTNAEIVEHLIVTKHSDGTYHVHGCIDNKKEIAYMIKAIKKETGPLRTLIPGKKLKVEKESNTFTKCGRSLLII